MSQVDCVGARIGMSDRVVWYSVGTCLAVFTAVAVAWAIAAAPRPGAPPAEASTADAAPSAADLNAAPTEAPAPPELDAQSNSGPAQAKAQRLPASAERFDLECSGPDALLNVPFEANYSIDLQKRRWALCTEGSCNDATPIVAVSDSILLLENSGGFRTTYSRADRVLVTIVDGPQVSAPLRRLACHVGDFTIPPAQGHAG